MNKTVFSLTLLVTLVVITFAGWKNYQNQATANLPLGVPIEVTNQNFEQIALIEGGTTVLLDLWSPDCLPSLYFDTMMVELAQEYSGELIVGKVNLEENEEIGLACDIQRVPTLLFLQDGMIVKRSIGCRTREEVVEDIRELLGRSRRMEVDSVKLPD